MKAEVEKVISMSLTKIAESRGLRRGGTSLHKHLLISSVLTKARSAYITLDGLTVCTDDTEIFPAQSSSTGASKLLSFSEPISEEDQAALLDSRALFQLDGTEMDLPSDILNCVEKMGGIPDVVDVEFTLRGNGTASEDENRTTAELILAEFAEGLSSESPSKSITYLDLDQASAEALVSSLSADVMTSSDMSHNQLKYAASKPSCKRRRDWTYDAEESDADEEDSGVFNNNSTYFGTKRFRFALSENYTFRATCDSKENTIPAGTSMLMSISTTSNYNSSANRTPLEPFFTFKGNNFNFRTKKSQFEETEEESAEADASPFLFEDDDFESYDPDIVVEKEKNDRRVPSSNGSCSSSDEEHEQETAMDLDLDKITNLVQYFSFSKGSGATGTTGLVRSMSSPDLLSYANQRSPFDSLPVGDKVSKTTTKDLCSPCYSSHDRYHQRVLTMKV